LLALGNFARKKAGKKPGFSFAGQVKACHMALGSYNRLKSEHGRWLVQPIYLKGRKMTVITKVLGVFKGRTAKLAGAVAATLLLAPIPALGFTFLTAWTFNSLTVNAPAPAATSTDFATGTNLIVDMGKNGLTTQAGLTGSAVNPGAISFFTAQRDISVTTAENVNVLRSYQTLLQGASLQSIVYFSQLTGANAGTRINITPNNFNSAGIRFGRTF
jgi:hypothetical protein